MRVFLLSFLLMLRTFSICLGADHPDGQRFRELKLIAGMILTVGGIFIAADGFRKDETTEPGVASSLMEWTKCCSSSGGPWYLDTSGVIENTGNVNLSNVTVLIRCYDSSGKHMADAEVVPSTVKSALLEEGESASWSKTGIILDSEPDRVELNFNYYYGKEYEIKNSLQGAAGIALAGAGVYLIVDYIHKTAFYKTVSSRGLSLEAVTGSEKPGIVLAGRF